MQQSHPAQQNKIDQNQHSHHSQLQCQQNPQLQGPNEQKAISNKQQLPEQKMEDKHWEAQLIDGKFYLTDPQSLEKLKKIQHQIQQQKRKLETLEIHTIQQSFYSLQQEEDKPVSEKSQGAITDMNQSLLINKKKKAEKDLHEQEQNYRAKIMKMQRKRSQIKKQMLPSAEENHKQAGPSESTLKNKEQAKQGAKQSNLSNKSRSIKQGEKSVHNSQKTKSNHLKSFQQYNQQDLKAQSKRKSKKSESGHEKSKKSQVKKVSQHQPSKKNSVNVSEHNNDISKQISQKLNLQKPEKSSKKSQSAHHSSNLSEARKKYNIAIHQHKDNSNDQLQLQNEQLEKLSKMMTKKDLILEEDAQIHQQGQKVSRKSEFNKGPEIEPSDKAPISQRVSKKSQKNVNQQIESKKSRQMSNQQQQQKSMKEQQIHSRRSNFKSQKAMPENNNIHLEGKSNVSQRNQKSSVANQVQIKLQKSVISSRKPDNSSASKNKSPSIKNSVQKSFHKQNSNQDQSYLKDNKSQQFQYQKSLLDVKSNRNIEKPAKSSKIGSQKNYQEASQKAEDNIQPSQKSGLKSSKMSIEKQQKKQRTIKSKSKFSERGQKSIKQNSIVQNEQKTQNKIEVGQEYQNKINDKSSKSQAISKKSSRNSKQNSSVHHKQQAEESDRNSSSVKNHESIEQSQKPNLIQKQSEQSVISSIKPRHLEELQSKKDIFYDHKSVQWSQRPENINIVSQQANFGKNKKVYQASQKSHKKSNKIVEQNEQKEQAIQQKSSHKKSIQIQKEKSIKEASNVDGNSRQKNNLGVDFLRKTKKQDIKCNQSEIHEGQYPKQEKRNKSFIIHYQKQESARGGSHKSSQKRKSSAKKSSDFEFEVKHKEQNLLKLLGDQEQQSKAQIQALNKQVKMLQDQLKKVEQRQIKIEESYKEQKQEKKQKQQEKFNFNMSDSAVKIQSASSEQAMSPLFSNKVRNFGGIQNRLNIASSITHFNSIEQREKKKAQDYEKNEKQRLKEEISNLKKIIRDMQMDKIKSIDKDTINSGKNQQRAEKFIEYKAENSQILNRWKQSLNSNDLGVTQQLQWNSDILNTKKASQMVGKIVKISPKRSNIEMNVRQKPFKMRQYGSLQRKQSQMSQPAVFGGSSLDKDLKALTMNKFQSYNPSPRKKVNPQLVRQQILERLEKNQKNFQKFVQCSKIINDAEQNTDYLPGMSRKSQHALSNDQQQQMEQIKMSQLRHQSFRQNPSMIDKKNKLSTLFHKFNSHQTQKIEQIPSPEQLTFSNWEFPKLPDTPNQFMKQDDLLQKAKQTYELFGIKTQNNEQDLCLKKYKNCVMFTYAPSSDVILWHFSGKFYIGGWKVNDPGEGQKSGEGIEYIPQKYVFKGQFLNGKKNGNGLIKTSNGNIYEGQFVDGVKNGRGKYFEASTNATYNGQWRQGKKDGFGVLKFSQKQYYQGTFVKSIKHGYGTEKFINGDYYKGQYSNGRFCGKGKYVWSNSSCFQGDFVDGCRHGQGTWRSSSQNGDVYIGEYVNDKKCGYGRYVWANGCTFEGYFKNDVKHGKGRLSYPDNKQIKGTWENGSLVSTDQNRRQFEQQDQPLQKSLKFQR